MAQTFKIESFLGVNKKSTETLLELGEASDMKNCIITDDRKLKKMHGYSRLFDTLGDYIVNGIWYGTLLGTPHMLFACNGHIYEHNLTTHANTDLGSVEDTFPTTFWVTNNTVYIMDGDDIYSWPGSGSIASVVGYAPTITTATPPSGGGTLLEPVNYLSGTKKQQFSADGTSVYQLAEYTVDSVDEVVVNGVVQTLTTDYNVNLLNGTVTFVSPPSSGTNNVVIKYTKVTSGDRELITNNMYYGGVYFSRFWLFGNPNHKNTRYPSGITINGVSDPTYWPKYADSNVGEYEITAVCIQYNKQIIFTSGDSKSSAWYSEQTSYTDESTGLLVTLFPVYPMNEKVGNAAKGQVQIIYNNPFTIWQGIYEWVATNVVNEKNATYISERIQNDLDLVDLSGAITCDWSDKGQYWLCVGKKVWVLNYRVNAWYILELAHTPTRFTTIDSELYFGTDDGKIMKFDETEGTFDGETISSYWDMAFFNFGTDYVTKYVWEMGIAMKPLVAAHVDIYVSTDKNGSFVQVETQKPVRYIPFDFENLDFETFSFETNYSPQPFRRKIRLKQIVYMKIRLANDGADGFVVLSITLPVEPGDDVGRR